MLQWSLANLLAWAAQVGAIVAAGLLLPVLLRVRAPGARLVFLRVLLLACLVLPLLQPWAIVPVTSTAPLDDESLAIVSSAVASQADLSPGEVASRPPDRPTPLQSLPWQTIAIAVLAIGVVGRIGWLGLGLLSLMRLRRSSQVLDPQPAAVEDAALVVGSRASFRVSPRVQRPVTFGLRQPVVLVPEGFLAFTPAEQSAIACHELLHVRRRDWLRTLAEEVVCAVLWFHPAIWWLVDQIHLSAEQVIDRHVVRLLGDRRSYLQALLRLAASGPEPMLQPAALFLKHGHLRQRVAMLIKETPMSRIRLAASFAVVLTVLACGGWLAVQAFPLSAVTDAPVDRALVDSLAPMPGANGLSLSAAMVSADSQGKPTVDPKSQAPRPGMTTTPAVQAWPEVTRLGTVVYPPEALQAGWVVTFVVVAGIDVAGSITTAEAKGFEVHAERIVFEGKSGVPPTFDRMLAPLRDAALDAVRQTKFKPLGRAFAGFSFRCEFDADRATARLVPAPPPPPPGSAQSNPATLTDKAEFERAMMLLMRRAVAQPNDPEIHYTIAAYYWDRTYRDSTLSESQKIDYVAKGMEAIDVALRLKPDYVEALSYKNLLLRLQANIERDPSRQQALIKEAETLLDQARALKAQRDVQNAWAEIPPNAVRVSGYIAPPKKIKDVKPVYPAVAEAALVQGVVIVETVIREDGTVGAVRVLRSIPLLDQAALDAVRQWEFAPTLLNGAAIPVVMTVTVNFSLSTSGTGGGVGVGTGSGVAGGVTGGVQGGVSGGVFGGIVGSIAAPPPPPPPAPLPPDTVRVGGNIRPPTKVLDVKPVYPAEAQDARVQGFVIIEAVIDKDGKVINARVLRSIPILDQAALDAVRQWEFTPTTVNGVPLNVIMTVTVNFTLR